MTLVYALIIFVLVVLVHEAGHFVVAKLCGIKVNEFSIGMGPLLAKIEGQETQYSLRILPIGGYVALEGEGETSDDKRSFSNAPGYKKLAVLVAGSAMNFLLALLVATIAFMNLQVPSTSIGTIVEDSPAQLAGLEENDEILKINGQDIEEWSQVSEEIASSKNGRVNILVDRGGQRLEFDLDGVEENGTYIIGIGPEFVAANVDNPLRYAGAYIIRVVRDLFSYIGDLLSFNADLSALSGPVGIVKIIGQSANQGLVNILFLTAMISANLGFINLLPIPALDGGSIAFTLIEMIIGREISENVKAGLTLIGITLLLALMLYITIFNDIL